MLPRMLPPMLQTRVATHVDMLPGPRCHIIMLPIVCWAERVLVLCCEYEIRKLIRVVWLAGWQFGLDFWLGIGFGI